MPEIIALFTVFIPHLSATTIRQFCQVAFALLAMTGRVTMLNISRWTSQGGSYRTGQRFFNTVLPWTTMCWMFFRTHLLDRESDYILAGDEVVVPKAGKSIYGLSRFFSTLYGKAIPGLSFLAVSLVSVNRRRSYPMVMEQIVRGTSSSNPGVSACEHRENTEATTPSGLHLISKLRTDAALSLPPTTPYAGQGRPRIYGERFNPQQIDAKYCVSTDTIGHLKTEIYQMKLRHKKFTDLLNVVCVLKTNLTTKQQAHILLFSSDLALDAEKMIDYYSLRFQIEFNFRDAKQYWGLQDFMNVNKIPVNLSMFMVSVSAKLTDTCQCENTEYSVLDLKARYRGLKYLYETLKILPQKPEPIVIEKIAQHLGAIGAIHHTQPKLNPG